MNSLLEELDDNKPTSSLFALLHEDCPTNAYTALLCQEAERARLPMGDERQLSYQENLGCQFPTGLDHIIVGMGFVASANAQKVPLGNLGKTLAASATHPDPLLAISDHCPTFVDVEID